MSLHVSAATPTDPLLPFNARDDRVVHVGVGGIRRARPLESNNTAAVFPKRRRRLNQRNLFLCSAQRSYCSTSTVERFEKRLALPLSLRPNWTRAAAIRWLTTALVSCALGRLPRAECCLAFTVRVGYHARSTIGLLSRALPVV